MNGTVVGRMTNRLNYENHVAVVKLFEKCVSVSTKCVKLRWGVIRPGVLYRHTRLANRNMSGDDRKTNEININADITRTSFRHLAIPTNLGNHHACAQ